MKSIERMNLIWAGCAPDHVPWVPSIYEHGASVIGRSPLETSRSADLMARAALESFALYQHDLVTVGIDIYNIEAEAFGCPLSIGEGSSIPGVVSHPLADDVELRPERLRVPGPSTANRLGLIAEAAGRVVQAIGSEVWVYACMGGPFSQAVELRGFENFIYDMADDPAAVHRLLEKTTALSLEQARRLSERGCGIYLYESWATLPLIMPHMFAHYVIPYNQRVIAAAREYPTPPPSVIMGGDTAVLADFFLEAGASLMCADFNTNFDFIRRKTAGRPIIIRGCADPKMIERGDWKGIERTLARLAAGSQGMVNFVWGCGCVSYHTTPEQLLQFKQMCLDAASMARARAPASPDSPNRPS